MSVTRSRIARPHVEPARIGTLTQGTVFNCAAAFRYPQKQVFGLTITARCDVAQEKYRLLNYIPVVRIDDWLQVDGLEILLDLEQKYQLSKVKSALIEADLSPSLLMSVPIQEIISVHFGSAITEKKNVKIRERLEAHLTETNAIEEVRADPIASLGWMADNRPKLVKGLIRDLFDHKVLGYYLLERLHPESETEGFVCLLREIATLPKEVAEELANGLSEERWRELEHRGSRGTVGFIDDELAGPVAQIGSPTIEHVMQSFANLFGRIGIVDAKIDEIDMVNDRLQSTYRGKR